jgi:SMC interacting uncharacterized protein involved in chromosome segregation
MSECLDPKTCGHSTHAVDTAEPEKFLEVKPVAPLQIETAASRRFDALAAEKAKRAAEREAAEAAAKAAKEAPAPASAPEPKPDYVPSTQVKNTQKLLEMIELRKHVRIRLVADKNRRGVEIEGEMRQAAKDRDARLDAVEAKARDQLAAISEAFQDLERERASELNIRDLEIAKLDKSLEQLRKQLNAELAKVDEDLAKGA